MEKLETALEDDPHISVENFTWSPVHIIQRFQNDEMPRPDRIVLVGASAVSRTPGMVQAFKWAGGSADEAEVQERVYEAVTGIVDLENTLMIGEYFKAWPDECYTVEADYQANTFGRLVLADNEGWADDEEALKLHFGYSPYAQQAEIIETTLDIARNGLGASHHLGEKSSKTLTPPNPFIENHATISLGGD